MRARVRLFVLAVVDGLRGPSGGLRPFIRLHFPSRVVGALRPVRSRTADILEDGWEAVIRASSNLLERMRKRAAHGISRRRVILWGTALAVFLVVFWVQWRFTYRYVDAAGGMAGIVQPLNVFLEEHVWGIRSSTFQINNYTGNPIFLLPFVLLFDYSPDAVRLVVIGTKAAGITLFFLIYHRLFGYRKAVLGILILSSMTEWLFFRWFDYTYSLFMFAALTLLYVAWEHRGADLGGGYAYLLSFLGGICVYFKATVLYLLVGIGIAVLYRDGVEAVKSMNTAVLAMLFLVGGSPALVYTVSNAAYIQETPNGSLDVSVGGPADIGVLEGMVVRFDQLGRWIRPNVQHLGILLSPGSHLFGYEFNSRVAPGDEVSGEVDVRAILTGNDYDLHHYSGTNVYSILLLLVVPYLLIRRKNVDMVLIGGAVFVLLLFLPSTSGFRVNHLNVLVPFVPLFFLAAIDTLPERIEETSAYQAAYLAFVALFVVSFIVTVINFPTPQGPDDVPLGRWGGDQRLYVEFQDLDVTNPLVTNSYKVYITSEYFHALDSVYLLPSNYSGDRDSVYLIKGTIHKWPLDEWSPGDLDEVETGEPVSMLLRENLPCRPDREFCGASAGAVMAEFGITPAEMERITLDDERYWFVRRLSPGER